MATERFEAVPSRLPVLYKLNHPGLTWMAIPSSNHPVGSSENETVPWISCYQGIRPQFHSTHVGIHQKRTQDLQPQQKFQVGSKTVKNSSQKNLHKTEGHCKVLSLVKKKLKLKSTTTFWIKHFKYCSLQWVVILCDSDDVV